jgi:hypothetical protein
MLTRVQVGDYDAWKPMFDADEPDVRSSASGYRVFRSADDPNEVFIAVEFDSREEAEAGRARLVGAGVLERFPDHNGPTVAELVEAKGA